MLTGKELGAAIEQARKKKGVTKVAFAEAMGVKPSSVQDWVKFGRIAKERIDGLVKYFADVVGPEYWGLDFVSHPQACEEIEEARESAKVVRLMPSGAKGSGTDEIEVPRFEAPASMGLGRPVPEQDNVVELLRVSSSWVRSTLPHISSPINLAVLPASGDSMEPTFADSDLLWIDRGVTQIKTDAVYVLALRDHLYVKRLQRRPDGAILMISDNKSYDPYVIENGEREQFQVLGRVVFAWRGKRL